MKSTTGKWNIGIGLWVMAAFMLYGFYLIYARDFAPDREAWIAAYNVSPHFEARLAGLGSDADADRPWRGDGRAFYTRLMPVIVLEVTQLRSPPSLAAAGRMPAFPGQLRNFYVY